MSLQKFCEKYPEYCNQELYERINGRAGGNNRQPGSNPPRVYAKDIPYRVGSFILLEGVVMDVDTREYPRRDGSGAVKVTVFTLYDKTGKAEIRFAGDNFLEVSDGDIVRVAGKVNDWKGRVEVQARRVEKIGRIEVDKGELNEITTPPPAPDPPPPSQLQPKVDKKAEGVGKVLSLLKSAKSQGRNVYYDKLEGLLSKLGLGFSDIEKFVEVKEVVVPGSLEKVKVVVLKDGVA